MPEMTYKLAMGQMLVEGGAPDINLARAERMIGDAASQGCRAIVLPECLDAGWTFERARELAAPIPGSRTARLANAARRGGIYVAAGLTERAGAKVYNSAVLVSPEGELLLHYRKINELDIGRQYYATGDRLGVVETPIGTIGINICADNFPDSLALGHSLARMSAQILLSPCAWAVPADHDNTREPYGGLWTESYTTLTRLYGITVVGVSNVGWLTSGPWKGRKCIGCSLAVGPGGAILAQGPYGENAEALVVVDVTPRAPAAAGTDVAVMLESKGYRGP